MKRLENEMTNKLPKLTMDERLHALERAMEARRARTELKNLMKSGEVSVTDAIQDSRAEKMRVKAFLMAVPGIGDKKADKIMRSLGIAPNRRVRGLGRNQRAALLAMEHNGFANPEK